MGQSRWRVAMRREPIHVDKSLKQRSRGGQIDPGRAGVAESPINAAFAGNAYPPTGKSVPQGEVSLPRFRLIRRTIARWAFALGTSMLYALETNYFVEEVLCWHYL